MTDFGPNFLSAEQLQSLPFRSLGKNVLINDRVNFVAIENISIGDNVRIDADSTIFATGPVSIGSYVHIGAQSFLAAKGGIKMEDFSGLSQGVCIYSSSDDYSGGHLTNPTVPSRYLGVKLAPVRVGRHVIIGARSVVMPGCDLGDGCAVGALSLVKSNLEPWTVYAGSPVRAIRSRRRDLLRMEAELLS